MRFSNSFFGKFGSARFWVSCLIVALSFSLDCNAGQAYEDSPAYKDAAERYVMSYPIPFSLPVDKADPSMSLQIQRLCTLGPEIVAQVYSGIAHFDLAAGTSHFEMFPFVILDSTCSDKWHRHLLVSSWPDSRRYSIAMKPSEAWSGWQRSDPLPLHKGEIAWGYVDGEEDVRILTNRRLLTISDTKVVKTIALSEPIGVFNAARVSIIRINDDIYFGNDGGEWGGTLYRIDRTTGKISLASDGDPVTAIIRDPMHPGCALVARGLTHIVIADGELIRACHDSTQTLTKGTPVWSIAGTSPIYVAFSDGIGELQGDDIVNRRAYPDTTDSVAGLHYTKLPGIIMLTTGISQSVSVSGPVPMLAEWHDVEK